VKGVRNMRERERKREREREREIKIWRYYICYVFGFEDGGKSHEPRNVRPLVKSKKVDYPLEPSERNQTYVHADFNPVILMKYRTVKH
jgi:hypothetical protein